MGEPEHSILHSLSSLLSLQILLQAQEADDLPFISGEKNTSVSLYTFPSPLIAYEFYKNSIIWVSQAWFLLEEGCFWNSENPFPLNKASLWRHCLIGTKKCQLEARVEQ